MSLKYALTKNPLTPGPDDRSAVVYVNKVLTQDDLVDRMVSRGSTMTRAEVLAALDELYLAAEDMVKAGNAVNTPLFMIMPSIKGRFVNDDDRFDSKRHKISLRMKPGLRLRKVVEQMKVEKIPGGKRVPVPADFDDNASQTMNSIITPGALAAIRGEKLKFNEKEEKQGIFFIHQVTRSTTRVNHTLMQNMPRELIFTIPAGITSGNYQIEIRTVFKDAKVLRTGKLPYILKVG